MTILAPAVQNSCLCLSNITFTGKEKVWSEEVEKSQEASLAAFWLVAIAY